jgi:tetratricopeptide (TPR) repeat protein
LRAPIYISALVALSCLGAVAASVEKRAPRAPYDTAFALWAGGHQADAEEFLMRSLNRSPRDQGVLFFLASCFRSRFEVDISLKAMAMVEGIDPATPEGQAAGLINALDQRQQVRANFGKLRALAQAHRDRPLLMWMLAVQCRSLHRNEEGIGYYRDLLAAIKPKPGPVLLHQTYGNLLDEVGRHEEALVERKLAVKMEPAPWSYQGLGNTLYDLERFEEAAQAFASATPLAPERAEYWESWGKCLFYTRKYDAAIEKLSKATDLKPDAFLAWYLWGNCLKAKGDLEGAIEKYKAAVRAQPANGWAYQAGAETLRKLGRTAEADRWTAAWDRVVAEKARRERRQQDARLAE